MKLKDKISEDRIRAEESIYTIGENREIIVEIGSEDQSSEKTLEELQEPGEKILIEDLEHLGELLDPIKIQIVQSINKNDLESLQALEELIQDSNDIDSSDLVDKLVFLDDMGLIGFRYEGERVKPVSGLSKLNLDLETSIL